MYSTQSTPKAGSTGIWIRISCSSCASVHEALWVCTSATAARIIAFRSAFVGSFAGACAAAACSVAWGSELSVWTFRSRALCSHSAISAWASSASLCSPFRLGLRVASATSCLIDHISAWLGGRP